MKRFGYLAMVGVLVLLIGILVACGGAAEAPAESPAESPSPEETVSSPATSPSPAGDESPTEAATNEVTVSARDYSFDAPESLPSGLTTFRLANEGPELHQLQLAKLPPDKTMDDLQAAIAEGNQPEWLIWAGGPNAAMPGESTVATLMLEPGQHVMMCLIPSPDGTLHVDKGMIRPLEVTEAGATTVAEPEADLTMTLRDYAFEQSTPIEAGEHTIKVVNEGPQPHEVVVLQFEPGKRLVDFQAWEQGGFQGPPPGRLLGGITILDTGMHQYFTADFTPGDYVLLCFVPDVADGKPHLEHGMVQEFTVE